MAAKDLFENEILLQITEELKDAGVKFDKGELSESEQYMDNCLSQFKAVTGADEDILFDILKSERADLYKYIFHVGYEGGRFALVMVPIRLVDFAISRYFPGSMEGFWEKAVRKDSQKIARKRIKEYNTAFGIVPEKPKPAPKPKSPKTEKRVVPAPLHETGLKYSEYDEDYYVMILEGGKEGNVIVNPSVGSIWEKKDGLQVWEPYQQIYGNHKEFRYTDILRGYLSGLFVSERVRTELSDAIPVHEGRGFKGPGFWAEKCYLKAGDQYLPYYGLSLPEYKFVDKNHLKLIEGSEGIIYHGDSTSGVEDIVYHSFRPGVISKMPESERTMFKIDFHGLDWRFCLKSIKERIEQTGATGVKFVRSMDMNWWEYNEPNRRALEEYVKRK